MNHRITFFKDTCKELRHQPYENAEVVIVVFSIVNPDSFREAEKKVWAFYAPNNHLMSWMFKWVREARRYSRGLPIIIVGSKSDLRDEVINILRLQRLKNQKPVTREQGEAMAKRVGAVSYHECSATDSVKLKLFTVTVALIELYFTYLRKAWLPSVMTLWKSSWIRLAVQIQKNFAAFCNRVCCKKAINQNDFNKQLQGVS